jgi:elongation factor G
MKEAMKREDLFPLFCVSSERMIGVRALLTEIVQLMPSAYEMEELHAFTGAEGGQTVEIHADDARPFAALVFKTHAEPHVGDVSYFRVLQGSVGERAGGVQRHARRGGEAQPPAHPARARTRRGAAAARRRHRLRGEAAQHAHQRHALDARAPGAAAAGAVPGAARALRRARQSRDVEEKLQAGLHRLHDEDRRSPCTTSPRRTRRWWAGWASATVEITMARLRRKYGVGPSLTRPTIAYRETISRRSGQGRHKKQTGGKGQFGDCWIRMAPLPRGEGYLFEDKIVGGVIPSKFIPAVDRGVQEAAARGVLAGFPLVDFRVELYDGSYHSVDSSEQAFKMAGILAFRAVASKCRPALLEPLDLLEITTPDAFLATCWATSRGAAGRSSAPTRTATAARACAPWCRRPSCTSTPPRSTR